MYVSVYYIVQVYTYIIAIDTNTFGIYNYDYVTKMSKLKPVSKNGKHFARRIGYYTNGIGCIEMEKFIYHLF